MKPEYGCDYCKARKKWVAYAYVFLQHEDKIRVAFKEFDVKPTKDSIYPDLERELMVSLTQGDIPGQRQPFEQEKE